jgi:pimeloyl-ACP methyl ester carboxylesterase
VLLPGGWYGTSTNGNRIFVRLARELAEMGFPVIRVDWRGIGESGGEIDRFELDEPFPDEARAAADVLLADGCEDVALVGFCFGAHSALTAAVDLPVRALALVSLNLPAASATASKTLALAERTSLPRLVALALRPAVFKGWFDPTTRSVYLKGARTKWRHATRRFRPSAAEQAARQRDRHRRQLDRMSGELVLASERGADILFVLGEDDWQMAGFERMRTGDLAAWFADAGERVQVVTSPGDLHGFASLESQQRTIDAVCSWMARLAPGAPA